MYTGHNSWFPCTHFDFHVYNHDYVMISMYTIMIIISWLPCIQSWFFFFWISGENSQEFFLIQSWLCHDNHDCIHENQNYMIPMYTWKSELYDFRVYMAIRIIWFPCIHGNQNYIIFMYTWKSELYDIRVYMAVKLYDFHVYMEIIIM